MEKYGYENVYRITDYEHPWDGYNNQKVVIFEEFRSSLKIQDMLNYLDGYPLSLPSRYESYLEIQRTKGRRDVTEEDKNEITALCQSRLEKWEKGNAR